MTSLGSRGTRSSQHNKDTGRGLGSIFRHVILKGVSAQMTSAADRVNTGYYYTAHEKSLLTESFGTFFNVAGFWSVVTYLHRFFPMDMFKYKKKSIQLKILTHMA